VEPKLSKVYLLSPLEQAELDTFLEENLHTGRIQPSKSPIAAPVFFIKKKNGLLWLVQDYCVLNAVTVKNRYSFPLISELVSQLRGAKYFTKLDVYWGFNNVRIKPGDEWKVAFCINCSLVREYPRGTLSKLEKLPPKGHYPSNCVLTLSQTSFSHISTNSLTIPTVLKPA